MKYTPTMIDFIRCNFQSKSLVELTSAFNNHFGEKQTSQMIHAAAKRNGIKSGRTGRFKKGEKSWNSGMLGWDAGGRSADTRFKPFDERTTKPLMSESVCSKDGYVLLKVEMPDVWIPKHHFNWIKAGLEIPDGFCLWFIDNDRKNCDIDNLMLVSKEQLCVINNMGYGSAHPELKKSAKILADLIMETNKS